MMMTRKPSRDQMTAIRNAIFDIIDPPMTERLVFYQLVACGVIEKTETGFQKVASVMLDWVKSQSKH